MHNSVIIIPKSGSDNFLTFRPYSTGSSPTKCSILQIVCDSHGFIFDLLSIESSSQNNILSSEFHSLLDTILRSNKILKLGFSLSEDFRRLRESYGDLTCYLFRESITNYVDISKIEGIRSLGLSKITQKYLGLPLDKRWQCSDWQRRPLMPEQIEYAVLDAFVLLQIHDILGINK